MKIKLRDGTFAQNSYIIAAIAMCLNCLFEIVFQYRFVTQLEVLYSFASGIISFLFVKEILKDDKRFHLFFLYAFWPAITIFIIFISEAKLVILPFVASSFVVIFIRKFRNKTTKAFAILLNLVILCMYLYLVWLTHYVIRPTYEIMRIEYSNNSRYVAVLEETDLGATGGEITVYVGRNIDFGIAGRYLPRKTKYVGYWGDRPEIIFLDDHLICIDGCIIEINTGNYINGRQRQDGPSS